MAEWEVKGKMQIPPALTPAQDSHFMKEVILKGH